MIYIINIFSLLSFFCSVLLIIKMIDQIFISYNRLILATIINILASLIIVYCQSNSYNTVPLIVFTISFVTSFFILYGKVKPIYLYIALLLDTAITFFSTNINAIVNFTQDPLFKSVILFVIRLVILFLAIGVNKYSKNQFIPRILALIPSKIYILIFANLFCSSFISAVNNYQMPLSRNKENILNVLISFSVVLNIAIIVSLLFNILMTRYSNDIVKLLNSQINLQISHYEKLDKLNSDIRRFRHNYINHLHSVLALIRMNELNDAQKYIENLLEIEDTPTIAYNTGNHLADAILSDKSEKFGECSHIEFNGIIPPELDNVDLCTILSNSLDNAIEACFKCGGNLIDIVANTAHGYFVITITNPTDKAECFDQIPSTTKEDSQNHGFGLLSIEQVAYKYDGKINIHCADGIFELSVLLKI